MYNSSILFAMVGFSNLVTVGTLIAGTNLFFTWVSLMLVNHVGRKRILLSTVWAMALFLVTAAISSPWIPINHELFIEKQQDWLAGLHGSRVHDLLRSILLLGDGNTAWLSSEFFPLGGSCVRHNDVDLYRLGLQHHFCIHISDSDGKHYSFRRIWILCRDLLLRLDFSYT